MKNDVMIYVHIPFCDTKCYYCNFVSFCAKEIQKDYFDYLIKEIETKKIDNKISSIYIGGGTPSSVDVFYIEKILKAIRANYNLKKNCEITIECNPKSTTLLKLKKYFKLKINRISFGVQSLNSKKLEKIGRFQTKEQVYNAITMARQIGFKNINADLLLGLEKQTARQVIFDAKKLIKLGVNHISAYMLILEEQTKLYQLVLQNKIKLRSDDDSVKIYEKLYRFLKKKKFFRYEISSFAQKTFECKHNLGYWQLKEYLGFGVSAHSYINRKRLANSDNVIDYLNGSNKKSEKITKDKYREEAIMLALRTCYGVNKNLVGKKRIVDKLIKEKMIKIEGDNIVICENYFGLSNQIILQLI